MNDSEGIVCLQAWGYKQVLAQRPVEKKPFKRMYEALDCKVLPYKYRNKNRENCFIRKNRFFFYG